ncbi:MAG: HAMP domain-containing histidine kinase [Lachnospiraceae bacterium]|nr:HAMP domain-containing histidine kinase [Lachnospiraceae bacterium]
MDNNHMNDNQNEENLPENTEEKLEKPEKRKKKSGLWFFHSLQHIFLVAGAVFLAYVFISSIVFVETGYGVYQRHFLLDNLSDDVYEESSLFTSSLSQRITDIIIFGAIQSQLETNGQLDSQKIIDVTAYANRFRGVPDQYVTAFYHLGDLIKWSQNGFIYQRQYKNAAQLEEFFAPENVIFNARPVAYGETVVHEDENGFALVEFTDVFIYDNEAERYRVVETIELESNRRLREYLNRTRAIDYDEFLKYGIFISDIFIDAETGEEFAIMTNGRHMLLGDLISELEYQKRLEEDRLNRSHMYEILDNLYQTIEGKNVEDYVADYSSYKVLCRDIERAATDLSFNLGQYERYKGIVHDSNVSYAIYTTINGVPAVYSNYDVGIDLSSPIALEKIDEDFNRRMDYFGKYIKYNSDSMNFVTNTYINDSFIRSELQRFSYAYPEHTQIWISIDTRFPEYDIFSQGYRGFQRFFPYYIYFLIAAGICFIMFFILLIFLTKHTGRIVGEDGVYTRLRGFDRIYTEIWLALSFISLFFILHISLYYVNYSNRNRWLAFSYGEDALILFVVGGYIYLCSLLFSLFYYSLVRRIKAKSLFADSILKKFLGYFKKGFKAVLKFMLYTYDNSNLLFRFMLPVLGVVVFHILMLFIIDNIRGSFIKFTFCLFIIIVDIVIGTVIFISAKARENIVAGINKISSGDLNHKVEEKHLHGDNLVLAKAVNSIGESISTAVDISMRDERMKADLITNVSHDIKTPLTSIINYIDLIKREDITDETIKNYVNILDSKSQRLKQLTDDLVEASKISSGNIEFIIEKINLTELVNQTIGEFEDRFNQRSLQIKLKSGEDNLQIEADSRRIWRVMENLFTNIYKYAMPNTRVYIEITPKNSGQIALSIKNISEQPLNFNADELTERFIRGDVSRSTEGSGLGLSIAKSLTEAQNGRFEIQMDGDLFKVILTFPLLENV